MFNNIESSLKGNVNGTLSYAEYGRSLYQTEIEKHFSYANNYYEIEMEQEQGKNNFILIGVRLDKAVNANTGVKLSDDYKKIIFCNKPDIVLGRKFSFGDNIWLTIDVSTLMVNSNSCIVRRCNNVLRYKEKEEYDSEPCIIEYNSSSNSLNVSTDIILPNKTIKLYVQNNEITSKIKVNHRFIFGSQVFKVVALEDYNRIKTQEKKIGLLTFVLEYDSIGVDDDFEQVIAANGLVIEDKTEEKENAEYSEIEETQEESLEVSKEITELREGNSEVLTFTFNGEDVTSQIDYKVISEIPVTSYSVQKQEGGIVITCIHKNYDISLEIEFSYKDYYKRMKIRLRGLF